MTSVFQMVHAVLANSKEKLAAKRSGGEPTKTTTQPAPETVKTASVNGLEHDPEKVANALDYLADNIHLIDDDRSPQEKLAELVGLQEHLVKVATEGDEPKGPHQTTQAPSDKDPPKNPGMGGEQMGAGSNQMKSGGNTNEGTILEPGKSGQATEEKINPMKVEPKENAFPGDSAGNALETTQGEENRPGDGEAPTKIAAMAAYRAKVAAQLVGQGKMKPKVAAALILHDRQKIAAAAKKPSAALAMKAKKAGVPSNMASALISKFAEDAINPASISAGTDPELQSAAGANSAQSQGTEAGEKVPETKGGDKGREAIQSVVAAINATKDELKGQRTRTEMAQYLNEPAMSQAHDNVLNKALDSTSSAGVKIAAAARAALQKWASEDPSRQQQLLDAVNQVKTANAMMGYGPDAGAAGAGGAAMPPPAGGGGPTGPGPGQASPTSAPMPGADASGPKVAMTQGAPSDAALAAAAQDVTPEELENAHQLLESAIQGGAMDPSMMGDMGGMDPSMMGGGEQQPPMDPSMGGAGGPPKPPAAATEPPTPLSA